MPQELSKSQKKDEVLNRQVEFEVRVMPDGKLRAQKMLLLEGDLPIPRGEAVEEEDVASDLDEDKIQEMSQYLAKHGNGFDFGKFSNHFPGIKKRKLQPHFDIIQEGKSQGGRHRIELPPGHPLRVDVDAELGADELLDGVGNTSNPLDTDMLDIPEPPEEDPAQSDAVDDDADDIDPNEPSIPIGPGVQPLGVIRSYDAEKGFGFIRCRCMPDDVFFPRKALPKSFHGRNAKEMPDLIGVEVSFDFNPSGGRGPRTENMNLQVRWLKTDECWVLKRTAIPSKPSKSK